MTIIALLEGIGGLALLLVGLLGLFSLGGVISIFLGAVSLILASGLWRGRSWAWTLALLFGALTVIVDLLSLNIIGVVIYAVVLLYLTRPYVRAYFGRSTTYF